MPSETMVLRGMWTELHEIWMHITIIGILKFFCISAMLVHFETTAILIENEGKEFRTFGNWHYYYLSHSYSK